MRREDHWYFRPIRKVHRTTLQLPEPAAGTVRAAAAAAHPRETGGLLLGWWEHDVPVVHSAVEVPDPDAGRTSWTRHEAAAAAAFTAALDDARLPGLGYVGDWHSHPADVGPSGPDLAELRRISRQYQSPVLLAVVRHGGPIDTRLARRGRLVTAGRPGGRQQPMPVAPVRASLSDPPSTVGRTPA